MKKFILDFQQYQINNSIPSNCNAITFVNIGTVDCYVNKFLLTAGSSLAIEGNENEMDTTFYSIFFTGGAGNLSVIRKFYV